MVIIIVGGLGVLPLAYKMYTSGSCADSLELAKALSIYFMTIIATSAADLILNKLPNSKEARSLRMPALTFLIFGGIAIFLVQYDLLPRYSFPIAVWSTVAALILWWITNSTDRKYTLDDGDNPTNALGGNNVNVPSDVPPVPNVKM